MACTRKKIAFYDNKTFIAFLNFPPCHFKASKLGCIFQMFMNRVASAIEIHWNTHGMTWIAFFSLFYGAKLPRVSTLMAHLLSLSATIPKRTLSQELHGVGTKFHLLKPLLSKLAFETLWSQKEACQGHHHLLLLKLWPFCTSFEKRPYWFPISFIISLLKQSVDACLKQEHKEGQARPFFTKMQRACVY